MDKQVSKNIAFMLIAEMFDKRLALLEDMVEYFISKSDPDKAKDYGKKRQEIADWYHKELDDAPSLHVP